MLIGIGLVVLGIDSLKGVAIQEQGELAAFCAFRIQNFNACAEEGGAQAGVRLRGICEVTAEGSGNSSSLPVTPPILVKGRSHDKCAIHRFERCRGVCR